jgi:type II secretory pathway pseudopilin PulG
VTRRRDGERGLSIIEAIVVATITALLALLILPLLPRASESLNVAE